MNTTRPFKSEFAREQYLARYALRAKGWPVDSEERLVATSFGETFVRVSGREGGAPLLLLPGIGSTGLSLSSVVAGLSGPLRTYVIDNIHDVGRSVETKAVTSAADFTRWLDEVRIGLGLGVVDVLGLSYGGWICAQYALVFPSQVRRVVLLEEMVEDGYLATQSFSPRKMVPPLPLTDAQWAKYQSKTLFLAGDREVIFPPHEALAKLARVAPQIEAALLPGVGHDFFVVRADEVNQRVLKFLCGSV